MLRARLLPIVAVAALGLAGCGTSDDTQTADQPTSPVDTVEPGDPTTAVEATTSDAPVRGEAGDNPLDVPTDTPADQPTPDAAEGAAPVPTADTADPVVLAFDGRTVPLATTCAGADGAILATTEGEVTITLVREEGVAMRYEAEGTTAETDEVEVDESEDDTIYTATLSSDQVEPLAVTMTVTTNALEQLQGC